MPDSDWPSMERVFMVVGACIMGGNTLKGLFESRNYGADKVLFWLVAFLLYLRRCRIDLNPTIDTTLFGTLKRCFMALFITVGAYACTASGDRIGELVKTWSERNQGRAKYADWVVESTAHVCLLFSSVMAGRLYFQGAYALRPAPGAAAPKDSSGAPLQHPMGSQG